MIMEMYLQAKNGKYRKIEFSTDKINYIYGDAAVGKTSVIGCINYIFGEKDVLDRRVITEHLARIVIVYKLNNEVLISAKDVKNKKHNTVVECVEYTEENLKRLRDIKMKLRDSNSHNMRLDDFFKISKEDREFNKNFTSKNISRLSFQYYNMITSHVNFIASNKIPYYDMIRIYNMIFQIYDLEYYSIMNNIRDLEVESRKIEFYSDAASVTIEKIILLKELFGMDDMTNKEFVKELQENMVEYKYRHRGYSKYNDLTKRIDYYTKKERELQDVIEMISHTNKSNFEGGNNYSIHTELNSYLESIDGYISPFTKDRVNQFISSLVLSERKEKMVFNTEERLRELNVVQKKLKSELKELTEVRDEHDSIVEGLDMGVPIQEYVFLLRSIKDIDENLLEYLDVNRKDDIKINIGKQRKLSKKIIITRLEELSKRISKIMTKYYKMSNILDLENDENAYVEFSTSDMTLKLEDTEANQTGSTLNHSMIHISALFAFYEYLYNSDVNIIRRVLPLLTLDQPTQAAGYKDGNNNLDKTHVRRIIEMFMMFKQHNKNIQLIIVEQENYREVIDEKTFNDNFNIIFNGEKGDKLITDEMQTND